jgi:hypothetical protein
MKEQLDRIEKKINTLTVAVEHRLTIVETTQRGFKWLTGIAATIVMGCLIFWLRCNLVI